MKFCACIDTLFTDLPFYDRFQAAHDEGFESVEFWNRDDKSTAKISQAASKAGIKISGFNGDSAYSLVDPTHKEKYLEYLRGSVEFAQTIGAASVTIHSNALGDGGIVVNHYDELSDTVKTCSMYDMLLSCAQIADQSGINMNLEALNITTDHVGNFLKTTQMGAEMTRMIKCDRLKLLYDVYHMQLNEGSICDNLTKYFDQIGHIHIADAPGRHEPGTGEINYRNVFACLERLGYQNRIGFELFPEFDNARAVKAIMALK